MRKLIVSSLALLLVAALAPMGQTNVGKLQLVRVPFETPEQAALLMTHFDESHNHSDREIEIVAWPGDRAELEALGFSYRVVEEDLVARGLRELAKPHPMVELPGPDRSEYRILEDYYAEMEQLAADNPKLVKLFEMPRTSLEGRPILGLEIASDVKETDTDGRPIFYMDGVHHAREWPASEFTLMYGHYLAEQFGKNPTVTKLLREARVILVPIVNVDGFAYSRNSVTSLTQPLRDVTWPLASGNGFEGYWRKNRRSLTGVTVPAAQINPDAYGVDPNRNYGYEWGDQNGGSGDEIVDQTYRGSEPYSEPEVANVRDIVLSRQVTGVITNHTVQATVLRAGGGKAPDDNDLSRIAQRLADTLTFTSNPTVGYPTTGTTDDWAYSAVGAYGFTIEHGGSDFHCAYAECVGDPTDRTMKAFTQMLEVAADRRYHSVIRGKVAGGAAKLKLTKTFETPLSPGNPLGEDSITEKLALSLTTERDGSFEWHVGPSLRPYEKKPERYTLTISAQGKTKKIQVLVKRGQVVDLGSIKL